MWSSVGHSCMGPIIYMVKTWQNRTWKKQCVRKGPESTEINILIVCYKLTRNIFWSDREDSRCTGCFVAKDLINWVDVWMRFGWDHLKGWCLYWQRWQVCHISLSHECHTSFCDQVSTVIEMWYIVTVSLMRSGRCDQSQSSASYQPILSSLGHN